MITNLVSNKINDCQNTLKKSLKTTFKNRSAILNSFKIQLSQSIENKDISKLCKGLYEYKPPYQRINKNMGPEELVIHPHQTCFEMHIENKMTKFYIHTKNNIDTVKNLYKRYYSTCDLDDVDNLIEINEDDTIVEYSLTEPYFKSLKTDKKELQPISSLMDLQLVLQNDERILYQIIFTPIDPNWGMECDEKRKQYKENSKSLLSFPEKITAGSLIKFGFRGLGVGTTFILNEILDVFFEKPEKLELSTCSEIVFEHETDIKSKEVAFDTTIRVIIQTGDNHRKEVLKSLVDNALSFMDSDNQLEGNIVYKRNKTLYAESKKDFLNRVNNREHRYHTFSKNILNINELSKLMLLPTRSIQEKFFVDKNVTSTTTVNTISQDLFEAKVRIGQLIGTAKKGYVGYPNDPELYCLPKIVAGGMGSGKSNFTVGFTNDSLKIGNTVILFDYIDTCKIAEEVRNKNKNHIRINPAKMLNFSYPEIDTNPNAEKTRRHLALDFANCVAELVDTLNTGNMNDMTGKMKKLLRSAAVLCYLTNNKNIKYVYMVLTKKDYRHELLDKLSSEDKDMFEVYLSVLDSLTIVNKKTGEEFNDDDSIKYLLDRFDVMIGDGNLLDMFENETSNINFQDLLNSGKLITIEMPQSMYRHKWVKDVIVCYLLHRLWIACENRPLNNRKIVDIVLDEVHQLSNTKVLISKFACETRKFRIGFLFCCQYFSQFKVMLESIEGGTVHYILLSGSKPSNFTHVEPLIQGFTMQNFMELPKYHSMNLILTKEGCQTFITKMDKNVS